jgi:N utilization substance protein A
VNPEGRQAHILVPEDQLSLAIGKEGQNVRLAARLTGWKIDIKDVAKYDQEAEQRKIQAAMQAAADVEEEQEDDYEDEVVDTLNLADSEAQAETTSQEEE